MYFAINKYKYIEKSRRKSNYINFDWGEGEFYDEYRDKQINSKGLRGGRF